MLAGGGPADVVELTVALAREMLALAGHARRRRRGRARRRTRDGHLARDDPRAGRRSGCRRCPVARETARRHRRPRRRARRAGGAAVRHRRVAPRRRPRAQGGPGACTPRASTCTPSRATPCAPGSRCSPCSPTSPPRFARALEAVEGAYRIGDAGDAIEDGGPLDRRPDRPRERPASAHRRCSGIRGGASAESAPRELRDAETARRSAAIVDSMNTIPEYRLAGRRHEHPERCRRSRCTTTSTAALRPQTIIELADAIGLEVPATDADGARRLVRRAGELRLARRVPQDVRPHDGGHADPRGPARASRASSSRTSPPTA